jgi:hypothetical protein
MIIRQIDDTGDWLFGKGKNDYVRNQNSVIQNINTRLGSFLGDCFFSLNDGIDWFNLLGTKDSTAITLAVSAILLNTANVTGVQQVLVSLDVRRKLTVEWAVQSSFSLVSGTFQYDLNGIGG